MTGRYPLRYGLQSGVIPSAGGYGLAIGDPAENHWQMEAGWAPWWHYETLRIAREANIRNNRLAAIGNERRKYINMILRKMIPE